MQVPFIFRAATMTVDTGTVGVLDAVSDAAILSVEDLTNASILLNQIEDAGTATIVVEKTMDGINWVAVASKADTDFVAGANKTLELTLSDANGMPLVAKQVRATMTVHTSTGKYTMSAAGLQRQGYR